jgi:hypothetical protein
LDQAYDEIRHGKEPDATDSVPVTFLTPKTQPTDEQYNTEYNDREENCKQEKKARRDERTIHRDTPLKYSKGIGITIFTCLNSR